MHWKIIGHFKLSYTFYKKNKNGGHSRNMLFKLWVDELITDDY